MIANYSTSVSVNQSTREIQEMLAKAGAAHVATSYSGGQPTGMLFELRGHGYRLPARISGVYAVLSRERRTLKPSQRTEDHARRVAWRILRDWVRAQMAIIESETVSPAEAFLPYLVVDASQTTLFERWDAEQRAALEGGRAGT